MNVNYLLPSELRVLAIDPSSRGLGFVVLEGPERLVDWGIKKTAEDKNAECVKMVAELIDRYRPHVLVIEDSAGKSSRRRARVRELLDAIRQLAREKRITLMDCSPSRVHRAFAPKKDIVAAAIAGRFPELAPRLPRPRTLTMSEQYEMPVFDAMAFALTFFHFRTRGIGDRKRILRSMG
jgi:hypothetical protein